MDQKDAARMALRVEPEIAVFDHDPENGTYGHNPECKPLRTEQFAPMWLMNGEPVTDPEQLAELERCYEEQKPVPRIIHGGVIT